MPIEHQIDHNRRLVLARGIGILTPEDFFEYQRNVWSLAEVRGYNELVDMSSVEEIVEPTGSNIQRLADYAASMDEQTTPTKFAIVAPRDFLYGLGRMYQAYRNLNERSNKDIYVFKSIKDAMMWIER